MISVIVPTLLEARRSATLWRAIHSILSQEGVDVELLVIVNGTRYDEGLLAELRRHPGIDVHYLERSGVALAQRYGRSVVRGEYYCFLDDDDELLPGALAARLAPFTNDPAMDVVVTNGYFALERSEFPAWDSDLGTKDPLLSLLEINWLASCNALFRTEVIGVEYFDGTTNYLEWTILAFRLSLDKRKLCFLNVPTFRIHDTPESASKTGNYERAVPEALRQVLRLDLPPSVSKVLQKKLGSALHELSVNCMNKGSRIDAWRYHLLSLVQRGGHRYVFFTRRLLPGMWASEA